MRRLLVGCFLVFVLLTTESAGFAADKWLSVRSKNFLLVGNASESAIRRVGRDLEEFRAGFGTLFPAIVQQAPPPITVVVFKDDASFRPFKPLYQGKPSNVGGFFQSGPDVNFIALTGNTQTPHVIYHEFVHSLTKDSVSLPPWASEGLAEFYGTFEIDSNGKEMMLGRPMSGHIETLRDQLLSIDTLFAVDHDSPHYNEQSKRGIFYAESWAVVHYLMLGSNQQRRTQLGQFLNLFAGGKPLDESFRQAFQTDYRSFERELKDYVSRYTFPVIRYKLQNKIDFDREMQVSTLTEAQAQYYLGDLLLHMDRLDTAETQLAKAISLDSGFAPSHASMGMLKVRQSKYEEALKSLTQAVQADSKNYMAHYYYAFMMHRVGGNLTSVPEASRYDLMAQHLKRTIELAPSYLNAYDLLGYVALNRRQELVETQNLLTKALSSAPARGDLRLRLGELMMANKQHAAAQAILKPLSAAQETTVRDHARMLLDSIDRFIDNEQALKEYEARLKEYEARRQEAARLAERNAVDLVDDRPIDDAPPVLTRATAAADKSETADTIATAKPQIARLPGPTVEGLLLSSDCRNGLTLRLRVGNGIVDLHSDDPSKIEFISFTNAVSDSFACGPLKSPMPVLVVYRRGGDARYLGIPVRVEFTDNK